MVSTSKMKILIAIIAWNEEDSIQKVFDGIKRLNFGEDSEYRVVVFNDSSTDDTLKISKNKLISPYPLKIISIKSIINIRIKI